MKVKSPAKARSLLLKSSKHVSICRNLPCSCSNKHGYRNSCYNNFTAVPKPENVKCRRESGEKLLRSDVEIKVVAVPSDVFEAICIFLQFEKKI